MTHELGRTYFRDKQREYRDKMRSKVASMQEQVHALEAQLHDVSNGDRTALARPKRDLLLPWEVVADVMKTELGHSYESNAALRHQIEASTRVLWDMQRFVHTKLWGNSILLSSHPESRRLGKLWTTHQMYINKTRTFHEFKFPPPDARENFQDDDVVFTESDGYFLIQRSHLTFDVPLEALRRMNQKHLCSLLLLAGSSSLDIAIDEADMRCQVTPMGECVNVVLGEFVDADQCTHVIQQIEDDELRPTSHRQRNRSTWIEMTRIAPRQTKVRALSVISQSRRKVGGFVPLAEEAGYLGLDKTQALVSDAHFRTQLLARTNRNRRPVDSEIPLVLATIAAQVAIEATSSNY